jgi:hypothetical protein
MTATTKNRFRPTLDVLEARDLPSVHLAASLSVATIQPSAELQAKTDPGSQQHKDNPTASLQAHQNNPLSQALENREMMHAGIVGAVMNQMMLDHVQGAQVRLLTQETSALQNQNAGIGGAVMHPMMPEFTNITPLHPAVSYISGIGFAIPAIIKFK